MSKNLLEKLEEKYYLAGWIEYGQNSSASFAGDTIRDALEDLRRKTEYYAKFGYTTILGKTVLNCKTCGGTGFIIKRTKRKNSFGQVQHRKIKCPACKGKNSQIIINP